MMNNIQDDAQRDGGIGSYGLTGNNAQQLGGFGGPSFVMNSQLRWAQERAEQEQRIAAFESRLSQYPPNYAEEMRRVEAVYGTLGTVSDAYANSLPTATEDSPDGAYPELYIPSVNKGLYSSIVSAGEDGPVPLVVDYEGNLAQGVYSERALNHLLGVNADSLMSMGGAAPASIAIVARRYLGYGPLRDLIHRKNAMYGDYEDQNGNPSEKFSPRALHRVMEYYSPRGPYDTDRLGWLNVFRGEFSAGYRSLVGRSGNDIADTEFSNAEMLFGWGTNNPFDAVNFEDKDYNSEKVWDTLSASDPGFAAYLVHAGFDPEIALGGTKNGWQFNYTVSRFIDEVGLRATSKIYEHGTIMTGLRFLEDLAVGSFATRDMAFTLGLSLVAGAVKSLGVTATAASTLLLQSSTKAGTIIRAVQRGGIALTSVGSKMGTVSRWLPHAIPGTLAEAKWFFPVVKGTVPRFALGAVTEGSISGAFENILNQSIAIRTNNQESFSLGGFFTDVAMEIAGEFLLGAPTTGVQNVILGNEESKRKFFKEGGLSGVGAGIIKRVATASLKSSIGSRFGGTRVWEKLGYVMDHFKRHSMHRIGQDSTYTISKDLINTASIWDSTFEFGMKLDSNSSGMHVGVVGAVNNNGGLSQQARKTITEGVRRINADKTMTDSDKEVAYSLLVLANVDKGNTAAINAAKGVFNEFSLFSSLMDQDLDVDALIADNADSGVVSQMVTKSLDSFKVRLESVTAKLTLLGFTGLDYSAVALKPTSASGTEASTLLGTLLTPEALQNMSDEQVNELRGVAALMGEDDATISAELSKRDQLKSEARIKSIAEKALVEEEAQPTAEAQPMEEAQPTTEAQPMEEAQPTAEAQPTEEAQPTAEAQPMEEAQPTAEAQPQSAAEVAAEEEIKAAEESGTTLEDTGIKGDTTVGSTGDASVIASIDFSEVSLFTDGMPTKDLGKDFLEGDCS